VFDQVVTAVDTEVRLGISYVHYEQHARKGMLAAVRMPAKLYLVHGSHPCRTVARAMRMKGVEYSKVELMPPMQALVQPLVFGKRTVPGVKFEDGEKVQGSVAILRRLEEMHPDPPLYPAARRAEIEEAERWGDEVLQAVARRVLWTVLKHNPRHIASYQDGSKLKLPAPVVRLLAPGISRIEQRLLSSANDEIGERDARSLPQHFDRIDAWLADGLLGGDPPNAADLQIAASIRLLMTLEDVALAVAGRPAGSWACRLFPDQAGHVPAGAISVGAA
jgi:glutathione S-transferase